MTNDKMFFLWMASIAVYYSSIVDATSIKMDFLPSGHVRTDPIISQTCVSDHVHTFYGANVRPYPDITYEELVSTPDNENTGNVQENKSLYWHPTVYRYDRNTQTYSRDIIGQTSAYYIWENQDQPRAFPPGFRMIAGTRGNTETDFPNAIAECVNPSMCTRSDGCYTENNFFPETACEELEVSMFFPSCWDGENLDSPDHMSHVAYTTDGEVDGVCPPSHPVKIPTISLFFRIFNYDGGWHTFSDGSGIFHADYISGWEEDLLQNVLDNCENDSLAPMPNAFCEDFLTFRDAPKCTDIDSCDFADPALLEKLQGIQPELLDFTTISPEETNIVQTSLPRGNCVGTLLPRDDVPSPSPSLEVTSPPTTQMPTTIAPVPIPTPFPSSTTIEPTETIFEECENEESFYFRGKMRTCFWASHILCRKKLRDGTNGRIRDRCELTCWQNCDPDEEECIDDDLFNYRGKERDCEWAGSAWCNLSTRGEAGTKVRDHCREWCDVCGDV